MREAIGSVTFFIIRQAISIVSVFGRGWPALLVTAPKLLLTTTKYCPAWVSATLVSERGCLGGCTGNDSLIEIPLVGQGGEAGGLDSEDSVAVFEGVEVFWVGNDGGTSLLAGDLQEINFSLRTGDIAVVKGDFAPGPNQAEVAEEGSGEVGHVNRNVFPVVGDFERYIFVRVEIESFAYEQTDPDFVEADDVVGLIEENAQSGPVPCGRGETKAGAEHHLKAVGRASKAEASLDLDIAEVI